MDKTDAELKSLEKEINKVYSKAYQEMKKEASDILAKIQLNPDMPLAKKMALMTKHDRLNNLSNQLANTVYNANSMAQKMVNKEMVNIYEMNYNENAKKLGFDVVDHTAVKKILTEEENPFNKISSLYDKVGIRNQMKGELMTGLLKGESIDKIARRFKNVSEKSLKDSIRIARTETTRVQNSAKMDVGYHGQELGFDMWKRWVATTDGRVREDHLAMNGVEVPQDEPFVLPDGSKMMFPADVSLGADVSQVVNCRCTMIEFIKEDNNKSVEKEEEKQQQKLVEPKILTQKEKDAVDYYVSGDGMFINDALRERTNSEGYTMTMKDLNKQDLEYLKNLDNATSNEIEPQILYRSVDASAIFGKISENDYANLESRIVFGDDSKIAKSTDKFVENAIGKTITDKGFMSTTTDFEIASEFKDFTGSEKPIVLEIETIAGTKGLSLAQSIPDLNEMMEQEEVLLARNQKYEILSVSKRDGNIYVKTKIKK